jgi:hypothetical protein
LVVRPANVRTKLTVRTKDSTFVFRADGTWERTHSSATSQRLNDDEGQWTLMRVGKPGAPSGLTIAHDGGVVTVQEVIVSSEMS